MSMKSESICRNDFDKGDVVVRGDRVSVADTPICESFPHAMARVTLHWSGLTVRFLWEMALSFPIPSLHRPE